MNRIKYGLLTIVLLLTALLGCKNQQAIVAERGESIMPFDLERTTHIFEKQSDGGLQQVISDDGDKIQIDLIRSHLQEESIRFSQGNFHSPSMIHGDEMPGLHTLITRHSDLIINYSEIENGSQIVYTADDEIVIEAIHLWFDAQVSDHGNHAQSHQHQ